AASVGNSLLISPIVGFACAALLLLVAKALIPRRELYEEPSRDTPPPFWIRGLLVLTCTGVSFAHGSNDGQKGMGLIMLILIGTVPTAYALNHAVSPGQVQQFIAASRQTVQILNPHVDANASIAEPREELTGYLRTRKFTPGTLVALRQM